MTTILRTKVCYAMSKQNPPVARVRLGETFRLQTEDCYSGNLTRTTDVFTKDMWGTVNPATGPVYVEGTKPGDILRVDILAIRTRNYAVMCVEHGAGALGEYIDGVDTSILPIRRGRVQLDGRSIPIRPMIGVIGTAPRGKAVPTGTPGEHGGNMDCKVITAGAAVYLPVSVAGALLSAGDIHAIMGDGEVCICGAEVSGEIALRCALAPDFIPTPCVESEGSLHFLGSARQLDACERMVLRKAHAYLTRCLGYKPNAAARLMSLVGDLRVCQVVDPLKTMRFSLPKRHL